jgi:hypothetical protein
MDTRYLLKIYLTHNAKDLTSTIVCVIPKFAHLQYHENKRQTQILAFKVGAYDESQPFLMPANI